MDEKQRGKLGSLLNMIWIPLLFTSIFGLIFISVLDIPVWKSFKEWGNSVPVVKYLTPGKETEQTQTSDQNFSNNKQETQEELKEMNQKIADLEKQLSSNQKTIGKLKNSNEELQKKLEEKQSIEYEKQQKKVADIYAAIPASKAATMLESMPIEEATLTLSMLKQKQQSSILGSMKNSKMAAEITIILKEMAGLNETDQTSLQEQVHDIVLKHENPTNVVAETLSGMQPTQAASMIQAMMTVNSQVTLEIVNHLSADNRYQIKTEIAKTDAEMASKIPTN
jgi:flagellar motility protein MotE (MotC chaperone)